MSIPFPHTILILDDDREHLQIESWIMHRLGVRVVTVVVGRDSFSLPEHERPSLVFLDYLLNSNLTPLEVVALLRQTFPGVPIVLLSSSVDMPLEMTTLVDAFVRKDDPANLMQFVQTFFESGVVAEPRRSRSV